MVRRKRKVYVLSYVAYTFFFGAALTVAGLFLWDVYLGAQIEEQSDILATERQRFSQSDIERVRELDQRLEHVEALLKVTPFVSQILTAVENATPNNMQIGTLSLIQTGASDGRVTSDPFSTVVAYNNYDSYTLSLEGTTDSFDKLLFQKSVLQGGDVLTMAAVTDLAYGDTEQGSSNGPISFTITTEVPFGAVTTMAPSAAAVSFDDAIDTTFADEADVDDDAVLLDEEEDNLDNF